jgi:hypothetical protein
MWGRRERRKATAVAPLGPRARRNPRPHLVELQLKTKPAHPKTPHQISTIHKQSQREIEQGCRDSNELRRGCSEGGALTCGPLIACSEAYGGGRRLWPVTTFGDASRSLATPRPVSPAVASSWRSGAEELRPWPGRSLEAR